MQGAVLCGAVCVDIHLVLRVSGMGRGRVAARVGLVLRGQSKAGGCSRAGRGEQRKSKTTRSAAGKRRQAPVTSPPPQHGRKESK